MPAASVTGCGQLRGQHAIAAPARHRGRPVRARGVRACPASRDRHDDARYVDGVLARAHADRHVPSFGPDWHLDVAGEHTFEAFLAERHMAPADVEPIPISVYLDYTDWFAREKGLPVDDVRVERLTRADDRFAAELEDGEHIEVDAVVAGPGHAPLAPASPASPCCRRGQPLCRATVGHTRSIWWISTSCRRPTA